MSDFCVAILIPPLLHKNIMATTHQSLSSTNEASNSLMSQGSSLLHALKGGNGLMLLIAFGGWLAIALLGKGQKKGKLATAQFARIKEQRTAKKIALAQIKARKHNEVAFKVYDSVYLPFAQESIAVCGGSGKGKTASMILPIAYSAIEQGFLSTSMISNTLNLTIVLPAPLSRWPSKQAIRCTFLLPVLMNLPFAIPWISCWMIWTDWRHGNWLRL